MSLKTAIQFRFLAAQLTQSETHQFVTKLLNGNNNIIITALFHEILNTSINQQAKADNINNTISNIILSRKKKPKPLPVQNIKLDQLPKRLIGVISSFLNQNHNINFSKTNRWIFLGCNSPNLLKKLDLIKIGNYSCIHLSLYPSVKELGLDLHKFNEFIPAINGLPVMNQLEAIELNGEKQSDINIDNFLPFDGINVDNIKKLRCSNFGDNPDDFPVDKFMTLLTKFPNIQYLELYGVVVMLDATTIKAIYPNLKGLKLVGSYDGVKRSLINTFGNNLDFLSFIEYCNNFDLNLENTNFGSLQELVLWSPTIKSINNILLTAKNLKKVSIASTANDSTFMKPRETKKIMKKLITTCRSLQYIEFRVFYALASELLEPVLDGMENGLLETTKWKRNEIKIHIIVECNDAFNPYDFVSKIGKIIHWLDCSDINDFMFIFSLIELYQKIDENILLKEIKELKSKGLSTTNVKIQIKRFIFINNKNQIQIVVTNINCKINGLSESWKM